MSPNEYLSLVACGAILALAFLVFSHRGRNPLALPLGLLCLDMFVWNFATWAFSYSGEPAWHWLDVTFSPFTPPLTLHVVLVFTGRVDAFRRVLLLAYGLFALLSVSSAAAFVLANARRWVESTEWSVVFLSLWAPLLIFAGVLLVQHLRGQVREDERMRTRLVITSIFIGAVMGSTEMWNDMVRVPALGHVGALGSMMLAAMVVLRFKLLGSEWSARAVVYALALAVLGVVGYLAAFHWLATRTALLALTVASITLGLVLATADVARSLAERWQKERQLAFLGRFSAQMAHDMKNPLAALKGALDYLVEERARGTLSGDESEFLELARGQVRRVEQVLATYQRFGEEPAREATDVGALLRELFAGASPLAAPTGITVSTEIEEPLPPCALDRALVTRAIENIAHNAFDAMADGGTLRVHARRGPLDGGTDGVILSFADDGQGMDARQRALAFDEFHSTKGSSGLGLAFVRRVVEAHEGEVRIDSVLGQGTTVELRLPALRERTVG